MSSGNFTQIPQKVTPVNTKYRTIKTRIPVPESISILRDLAKYESRSMHGQLPVVWDKAKGFQVSDKWGNRWIDFTSTIFVANTGHSNRRVISALEVQIKKPLIHTYTFASEVRGKFLKQLVQMTPAFCQKAFLLSSGTEATECALKLMRMYGQRFSPRKTGIISFRGGMHGRTMGAEMLKGDPRASSWIGYTDPNIFHLPFPYPWITNARDYDWAGHFQRDLSGLVSKGMKLRNICGIMIESYLGWGAIFYPKDYIKALVNFARKHHILVTFDEIQSGMGRTGRLFAYEHYEVTPDLLCLGKALSGGLPLSAVVGRKNIMDLPEAGSMSSTHSANPLCCAAGLANLKSIEEEKLVSQAQKKGKILHQQLNQIKEKFPKRIAYICGKGMVAGIIIKHPESKEPDSEFATRVCQRAMQKGLLTVHTGRESLKIGPPLVIPKEALLEGLAVLEESISEIDKQS